MKGMSASEFKEFAMELLPHLEAVQATMRKYLEGGQSAGITISTDGFISFRPHETLWELVRHPGSWGNGKDCRTLIRYEYSMRIDLGESEGADSV